MPARVRDPSPCGYCPLLQVHMAVPLSPLENIVHAPPPPSFWHCCSQSQRLYLIEPSIIFVQLHISVLLRHAEIPGDSQLPLFPLTEHPESSPPDPQLERSKTANTENIFMAAIFVGHRELVKRDSGYCAGFTFTSVNT
jgi:hypothetical protein